MNREMVQGTWNQIKGSVKETFGKLTDDDMLQIEGSVDRAVGVLQARYGYTKERAQEEWDNFLNRSNRAMQDVRNSAATTTDQLLDKGAKAVKNAADSVKSAVDSVKEKAKA